MSCRLAPDTVQYQLVHNLHFGLEYSMEWNGTDVVLFKMKNLPRRPLLDATSEVTESTACFDQELFQCHVSLNGAASFSALLSLLLFILSAGTTANPPLCGHASML
ncbi:hypothetical protein BGAL_0170g00020 [Botrytis galanthina]|uniref:Uncharacterized protein n=1 Tax=Botrytis galanthina TaxID=278940 RepID=A0A4S8R0F4_9HELO|nr:hypothetical protein BGAL_0170g00020 [Botrytis galanthina]